MRHLLRQSIVGCAVLAALSAAVAEDGQVILAGALSKRGEIRMSGVEVTEHAAHDGKRSVVERRVIRDAGGREFAEFTQGPKYLVGQRVICDGHIRYRVIPSRKVVLQSPPLDGGVLAGMARWRNLQALTRVTVEAWRGKDESTGRDAHILVVKTPNDDGVLVKTRRLAVDIATLFILDNRDYADGIEVCRTRYRSIDFWPEIKDGLFSYSPPEDMLVLPEPSKVPRMLDPDLAGRLGALGAPVQPPPEWSPAGAFLHRYGKVRVVQMSFVAPVAGGPLPVVLFRRDGAPDRCFFDDFYGLGETGARPAKVAHQALAWRVDPFTYVLASRIEWGRLSQAAQDIAAEIHDAPSDPRAGEPHGRHGRHAGTPADGRGEPAPGQRGAPAAPAAPTSRR